MVLSLMHLLLLPPLPVPSTILVLGLISGVEARNRTFSSNIGLPHPLYESSSQVFISTANRRRFQFTNTTPSYSKSGSSNSISSLAFGRQRSSSYLISAPSMASFLSLCCFPSKHSSKFLFTRHINSLTRYAMFFTCSPSPLTSPLCATSRSLSLDTQPCIWRFNSFKSTYSYSWSPFVAHLHFYRSFTKSAPNPRYTFCIVLAGLHSNLHSRRAHTLIPSFTLTSLHLSMAAICPSFVFIKNRKISTRLPTKFKPTKPHISIRPPLDSITSRFITAQKSLIFFIHVWGLCPSCRCFTLLCSLGLPLFLPPHFKVSRSFPLRRSVPPSAFCDIPLPSIRNSLTLYPTYLPPIVTECVSSSHAPLIPLDLSPSIPAFASIFTLPPYAAHSISLHLALRLDRLSNNSPSKGTSTHRRAKHILCTSLRMLLQLTTHQVLKFSVDSWTNDGG